MRRENGISRLHCILVELCVSLPRPGTKMLQKRQNHARGTGSTGMAPRIMDPLSTSDGSSFGLLSS